MEKKMMESMKQKKIRKSLVVAGGDGAMEKKKEETTMENGGGGGEEYEKLREERMRENMERMEKLGIVSLSHKLKSTTERRGRGRGRGRRRGDDDGSPQVFMSPPKSTTLPPRRSSRLQNTTPVPYAEISVNKDEKRKNMVFIEEGAREEFYTDEHAKLLGSCEMTWTLFVDGCGKDGRRIYDQVKGETCHQCRQKTLGLHTHCSKCDLVQGQFCGDCLYMRYGENVLEVKKNPSWICPVCRGICNCSLCRTKRGWAPTGSLYRKVLRLGFKSVAHYLIQTRRRETISADQISTQTTSPKNELPVCDREGISHPVDAFESENALNSESTNKNSNSTIEKSLAFNDTNDSSHPDEPTNGLNVDSFEKISNLSSEESKTLPVDEHANNSAIDVTPCGKSKKTKNSAAVASPNCIASKSPVDGSLPSNEPGNGVIAADSCEEGKLQCVDGHATNFVIDVKPRHKRKKSKDPAAIASPDCIASRLRRRTTCLDATTTIT